MIKNIMLAYSDGWRAGMCNAQYGTRPFRYSKNFVLSFSWSEGWEAGMKESLNTWLTERKA